MAAKKPVSVRIMDQTFSITTDAPPERVEKIADFVNKNLRQAMNKSKTGSAYRAAILAALNITEKYFESIEKQNALRSRVSEKSKHILGLLDGVSSSKDTSPSS